MNHDPLAVALAAWLDHRLTVPVVPVVPLVTSVSDLLDLPDVADLPGSPDGDARLFGLTVLDRDEVVSCGAESTRADGAVRFVAVAEGDAYWLAGNVAALAIAHYDALALVTLGWAAPLAAADAIAPRIAPSEHSDRWRVRVTTVAIDSGAVGSVLRCVDAAASGRPAEPADPGPVGGPLADLLSRSCSVRRRPQIGRWDHPPAA